MSRLVLFTEPSLDKEKGWDAEWKMLSILLLVTPLLLSGMSVKSFGNCQKEKLTAFTIALCRFWHPDNIVSRQRFPFVTPVWIYASRMRGREPCLKLGVMVVPAVWNCSMQCSAFMPLSAVLGFFSLEWSLTVSDAVIQGILWHAEIFIISNSDIIRFLLFITLVALKIHLRGRQEIGGKITAW